MKSFLLLSLLTLFYNVSSAQCTTPVITASGPTTFCSGGGVTLSTVASNTWTKKADFGTSAISGAVGFSIGNKGYIGTGRTGGTNYKKDFWEYDPASDTWTQKADFGGTARNQAVGFSIGSKGYIGTGNDGSMKTDFWEYDPVTNTWAQKADFGGTGRYGAVGFSIGNKGYIGTGINGSFLKDFWEYDPLTDTWKQKADFGGGVRYAAVGFNIGTKGYIGTGISQFFTPSAIKKDFWEYDPVADTWIQKADFAGGPRYYDNGYTIGNAGYITGGDNGNILFSDTWSYDPVSNSWTRKADFPNNIRIAVAFSIGSKGYLGTGQGDNLGFTRDFFEYDPGYVYSWSTGEATPSINVTKSGDYTVTTTNILGCSATSSSITVTVNAIPPVPVIAVADNCGSSTLSTTATGSLLWSTGETTPSINVTKAGSYSLTQTVNGCTSDAGSGMTSPKAIPSPPIVTANGPTTFCSGSIVTLSATQGYTAYQWSNGETTQTISATQSGAYSVSVTNASGCTSVASDAVQVTVNAKPLAPEVIVSNNCGSSTLSTNAAGSLLWSTGETTPSITVNNAGNYNVILTIDGCASDASSVFASPKTIPSAPVVNVTDNCGSSTLSTDATGSLLWSIGATTPSISVSTAGSYTVTQTVDGCTSNVASATAAPKAVPAKPVITPNGATTFYTGGSVTLSAPAGYSTYSWSNNATTQSIIVTASGSYSVVVTNNNGCSSASSDAVIVTVQSLPSTLSVSYMDGDNKQQTNNNIRPYLQLNNEGNTSVAYKDITIRYWLTVEDFAPMTNLVVDWAQLGTSKVKMKYVKLGQPLQGAYGYIEYSFDATAGTLAAKKNSGAIQSRAAKSDWTNFNEADDYSYAPYTSYTKNNKITVYQNGVLVGGTEPTAIPLVQSLKAYSQDKSSGTTTNTISNYLKLNNEGNTPVSYQDITIRYWFTEDGSQALNYYLDYAQLGNSYIKSKFVKLATPVSTADTYLELSFTAPDSLYPISTTGNIQQRIAKSDWSNFNQANDHSYQAIKTMSENTHVTVYVKGQLVYGVEPINTNTLQTSAANRMIKQPQADSKLVTADKLDVTVLNNPVTGNEVKFIVKGAQGKQVQAVLIDIQGRMIDKKEFMQSGGATQQQFLVQRNADGILFLRVNTSTEAKTVKIMIGK